MRVISIINLKGGVGKTFTAANMAHILNNQGKSVLLVDNDWRSCEMCNGVMGQCKKKQEIEKAR